MKMINAEGIEARNRLFDAYHRVFALAYLGVNNWITQRLFGEDVRAYVEARREAVRVGAAHIEEFPENIIKFLQETRK